MESIERHLRPGFGLEMTLDHSWEGRSSTNCREDSIKIKMILGHLLLLELGIIQEGRCFFLSLVQNFREKSLFLCLTSMMLKNLILDMILGTFAFSSQAKFTTRLKHSTQPNRPLNSPSKISLLEGLGVSSSSLNPVMKYWRINGKGGPIRLPLEGMNTWWMFNYLIVLGIDFHWRTKSDHHNLNKNKYPIGKGVGSGLHPQANQPSLGKSLFQTILWPFQPVYLSPQSSICQGDRNPTL